MNLYVHNRKSFFEGREVLSRSTENRIVSLLNYFRLKFQFTNYCPLPKKSIIIANRPYSRVDIDYLNQCINNDCILILDIDDDPFYVPNYLFSSERIVNNDLANLISDADYIFCENEGLKDLLYPYNCNTKIFKNFFDPAITPVNNVDFKNKNRALIVNAAGFQLKDQYTSFHEASHYFCESFGYRFDFLIDRPEDIKKSKYFNILKPFSYSDYVKFLSEAHRLYDFFIIPIDAPSNEQDCLYYSRRSHKRFIDSTIAGLPSVISLVPPYNRGLKSGYDFVSVDNSYDSWVLAFQLMQKADSRSFYLKNSQKTILENYDIVAASKSLVMLLESF